jgi:hypothetical protein
MHSPSRSGWFSHGNFVQKAAIVLSLLSAAVIPGSVEAASLNFAWDPVTDADIAYYTVYVGTTSGQYATSINVGNVTTAAVSDLVQGQTYYMAVSASTATTEGPLSSELVFTVNQAPVLNSVGGQPWSSGSPNPSFSVTAGTAFIAQVVATDPDKNSLAYTMVSGPSGASLTAAGLFSWTPGSGQAAGAYSVTVQVTDDGVPAYSDTETFTVQVAAPVAPNTAPALVSVGGVNWGTARTQSLLVNGSFESGYTGWTASGNQAVKGSGGTLNGTDGAYFVCWNAGNTVPNGVLAQTVNAAVGQTCTLSLDVGVYAFNQNEQRLQLVVQGATTLLNQTVSVFGLGSGQTKWIHQTYTFVLDSSSITLTLSDVSPTTDSLDLLVDNVQLVQSVIGNPVLSVTAGTTLAAQIAAKDSDVPTQSLTYSLVSGPAGASVSVNGWFSWSPAATQPAGTSVVTVKVIDNGSPVLSDTESFSVSVQAAPRPVNTAPALVSVNGLNWVASSTQSRVANGSFESGTTGWSASGNLAVKAGGGIITATDGSYYVVFNAGNTVPNGVLSQTCVTAPGQAYTLSLDTGVFAYNKNEQRLQVVVQGASTLVNQTVSVVGSGNGRTKWVGQTYSFIADSSSVTLTLKDVSPTSDSLDLLLDNVRFVQTSDGSPLLTVAAGNTLSAQVLAIDSDIPTQALTYSVLSGPAGATVNTSGLFTWTTSSKQSTGTNLVSVRVTDNGTPSMTDTKSFKVVVTAPLRIAQRTLAVTPAAATAASNNCVLQSDGGVLVQLQGVPKAVYLVEASSDLEHWASVGELEADENGQVQYADRSAREASARFYRLSVP